jgi:TPR repeat protein
MRLPILRRLAALGVSVLGTCLLVACSQSNRLKAGCLSGDVNRCAQLGEMYATGTGGVERDTVRAAEMFQRACDGGASDVCNTLGEIYEKSSDLEGGIARATQMYQRACNGGSSAGCLNLGLVYASQDDFTTAVGLFDRSCTGGWAAGCHRLAQCYQQGEGVRADIVKALTLFGQACDGEFLDACTTAAQIYASGQGVPPDAAAATALYGKAIKVLDLECQSGSDRGCTERDRLQTRVALLKQQPQPAR